jgi:O-methyltransferase involved in polyketide biosynthesis
VNNTFGLSDVDVTEYIKHEDPTDTAAWLTAHGWTVEAVDSRDEMARLGRPLPADLVGILPVSSLITATLRPAQSPTD